MLATELGRIARTDEDTDVREMWSAWSQAGTRGAHGAQVMEIAGIARRDAGRDAWEER